MGVGVSGGSRPQRSRRRAPCGHGRRAGDPQCLELIREEAKFLGQGFTSLIHLYSPERVIMGGGVSHAFDLLAEDMHDVIRNDAMVLFRDVEIVPAALADNSGIIGAAELALDAADNAQN
ncbi:ROK family protein [Mesorhizobium sp. IMUNJ 23033]|uniref:ROK family protein n=1 Tax=Mesorhizobium sp. IMUNJ 23033 TaxID=3378039 RepID=UPI00384EE48B